MKGIIVSMFLFVFLCFGSVKEEAFVPTDILKDFNETLKILCQEDIYLPRVYPLSMYLIDKNDIINPIRAQDITTDEMFRSNFIYNVLTF